MVNQRRITLNLLHNAQILEGSARLFICPIRLNSTGYRIVSIKKNEEMWNQCFKEHMQQNNTCKGQLKWHLPSEERRGMSCRQTMVCTSCNYKSKLFNLYHEVTSQGRGRKAADINLGLQVGLHLSPIGTSSLQRICLSSNIPAPSNYGMQKAANKVNKTIHNANIIDMKQRRARLKKVNEIRGVDSSIISVQGDGMYNNPLYSGIGKTPFQPATQTVYSFAENETKHHDIIQLITKNKLCSKHKHLSDNQHTCKPSTCSANIPFQKSIGDEYSWAKEGVEELDKEGLHVAFITTDPDSAAYRAASDIALHNDRKFQVHHSVDTRHFNETHRKYIKRSGNLDKIVLGRTKIQRSKMAANLALDIASRCQAEFNEAYKTCSGDANVLKKKLSYTCDAIIQCYQGSHEKCRRNSFVCKGFVKDNWVLKSDYLGETFKLQHGEETSEALRKCISYRLSPVSLNRTMFNANTQKVESFNRSLRRSLPRNVTFSRNFSGRAHAAAYSVNNGECNAIINLCSKVGSNIEKGSVVHRQLENLQKHNEKRKLKSKSIKYKCIRSSNRNKIFKMYEKQQEETTYKKNLLLKSATQNKHNVRNMSRDHPYAINVAASVRDHSYHKNPKAGTSRIG